METEDKIDELLGVLDGDIQHVHDSLLRLNELRGLVLKRDDVGLGELLGSIQSEVESYKSHVSERRSIREELANALGCNREQMTLSLLEEMLTGNKKTEMAEKKAKLRSLVAELKREYLSTAMLLSDCVRFNRLLLRSVFELGRTETVTYGCDGYAKMQADASFVNLRF